jgi:hypothetical protein
MTPKLTLHSLIGEAESCDLAFVLEERVIRSNSRSLDAQRLREQVDEFQHFKRVRSPGTSQGDLQACIALSKLRPEGLMVWAREEALSETDGREALTYLLERGRLLAEWNFSGVQSQAASETKLLPKHLYIWVRESDIQLRHAHRPMRISVQGSIKSFSELSLLIQDSLLAGAGKALQPTLMTRTWQVHTQLSPSTQKEWSENWPEPTGPEQLQEITRLRSVSLPLAQIGTVRVAHSLLPSTPFPAQSLSGAPLDRSDSSSLSGILLRAVTKEGERRIRADYLSSFKTPRSPNETLPLQGAFHLLIPTDEARLAPLISWLESAHVRRWLDHLAERKGDRWILTEQIVKYIPVPRQLLRVLGFTSDLRQTLDFPLPAHFCGEWESTCQQLASRPKVVLEKVRNEALRRGPQSAEMNELKALIFVRASQTLAHFRRTTGQMQGVIGSEGQIHWRELFNVLPKSEFTPMASHPMIRLTGTLPPQVTIARWEKVRVPTAGILLSTEAGFHLHLGCDSPRMLEMIWDQLGAMKHPTWAELAPWLRLPRTPERIEQIANDLLQAWHEQSARTQQIQELIEECLSFWAPAVPRA